LPRIVLGVAGGIAAYKAVEVLRGLTESGHDVTVVPTAAALEFVGVPTWAALSGKAVSTSVWDHVEQVPHVKLGQSADLVLVAPATADLIARATHGIADDLLTNILLTARCPIVMAPAMHTEMWEHPATQRNVAELRARGVIVLEPASGRLTGADTGPGRLPDPSAIVAAAQDTLRRAPAQDLAGIRILITAGGTREAIDPVRFIGNHSSGKQGFELARTAVTRGATVTVVAAHVDAEPPAGVTLSRVSSGEQMHQEVMRLLPGCDVVVMAAAVADFRADDVAGAKIKKGEQAQGVNVSLVPTTDILASIVRERVGAAPFIVGFAAETGDESSSVIEHGRAKLARKGCDLLVVNDVSAGKAFGADDNEIVILGQGGELAVAKASKAAISDAIWDAISAALPSR
jgi:phosphopantothenoylcysteine decarboxylase/phosphopantothenate--cysteine ligase